ncbi:MAG: spheroidene monooxygenase [Pseudomonadota bacterium]
MPDGSVSLARDAATEAGAQCVSLSFFRYESLARRVWVFGRMGFDRGPLARTPGIGFAKLMGTGTGMGFRPKPDWGVWTILAVWPDAGTAREAVETGDVWRRRRARADESCTIFMEPLSARGEWAGEAPFRPRAEARRDGEPLAVLTRATIKARRAVRFWAEVPDVEDDLSRCRSLLFQKGMGEVPWLHQVTFSVWRDAAEMARFAHDAGAHRSAVKAAYGGEWFTESLFARFAVTGTSGRWQGEDLRLI